MLLRLVDLIVPESVLKLVLIDKKLQVGVVRDLGALHNQVDESEGLESLHDSSENGSTEGLELSSLAVVPVFVVHDLSWHLVLILIALFPMLWLGLSVGLILVVYSQRFGNQIVNDRVAPVLNVVHTYFLLH